MSYLQALVIAVIQGVTKLFPVSSLGHSAGQDDIAKRRIAEALAAEN